MQAPVVSVLITCFNRELYLADAIKSVLNSTFENFELIIVDNASTDNSQKIALDYQKKDKRIELYVNDENIGQFNNRNKAASYAKGKYIKYLDSDDIIYPYSLQIMVDFMESDPELALGFSHSNVQDSNYPFPIYYTPYQSFVKEYFNGGLFYPGPSGAIINRRCFEEIGGFPDIPYLGDTQLWINIASKYKIVVFQSSLIWWRVHDTQLFKEGHLNGYYFLNKYKLMRDALNSKNCPLPSDLKKIALNKLKYIRSREILKQKYFKFKFKQGFRIALENEIKIVDLIKSLYKK